MVAAVVLTACGGLAAWGGFATPAHAEDGLEAWKGVWSGTCRTMSVGGSAQQFGASLAIRPLSQDGSRYSWTVTYTPAGGGQRQVRPYEIVAVDRARGHYVVDEKNGLKLDAYKVANQIFMPFTIGRVLITAKYVRLKQGIVMELPSFPVQPSRRTCLQSNPENCASSFALRSLQLCLLRRAG